MMKEALEALREGKFVLLYDFDDRERETDLIIRADAVTPEKIVTLRRDGGGLICTAVHPDAAARLGLPFASDLLHGISAVEQQGDIPYDRRNHSSFSLWVNHRSTFTGITDRDRAVTINAIAGQVRRSLNGGGHNFAAEFRTPGHVALLRAAEGLLSQRRGQTELSIAMAEMAGITPAVVVCEMLDNESGLALSKEDARAYGKKHGIIFVEGSDVISAWEAESRS
ncbi:3,4-dihydroxy 2-butanone 4-phosphate synthase [Methanolinea mesophila]|uniref:3,4-dihydroxy-2-butanone-4-phosphate synthase n=1 Tax=Methanolinea mesophila TaxID=547055 RepID=UPI001AE3288C|nr:3,4-dihydroxy-2-butanone-4-phosphate synthase [Methanolinea mesophila]MBP1928686.1 3,4-dihydroxy 2-butanone 4-phosphate synthase [Methanolinea mesophila]